MAFISQILAFFQSNMFQSIGVFLFMVVEYWLGKTDMVKAGSTLEVILNVVKKALEAIGIKKPSV